LLALRLEITISCTMRVAQVEVVPYTQTLAFVAVGVGVGVVAPDVAPDVAPEKVAVLTVMSAAAGTATLQPVAVLMADICVIRLEPEVPDATAVCTALAEETLVSTSIVNVIVAARRAAALEIATPVVYEMDPLAAVHQAVLTILTYAHS